MDFRFTEDELRLQRELQEFIAREWRPPEGGDEADDEVWEATVAFRRKLAQQGWLTMAWPREWGGRGASYIEQAIYRETLAYAGAPGPDQGVDRVGPTLMLFGTEEQKREFLPPIARAEVTWCQGYSEPGAGSDLASLQTRAIEDGDFFIVNGQKIWTSHAHRADWMFLLARTDPDAPKHRGISYFLLDMKTPGITIRPLVNMAGSHVFNQVFFDNVRIPKNRLVGEKNRGWYIGAATLDFERSGIERIAAARRTLQDLIQFARETSVDGRPLIKQPQVGAQLAELTIEFEIGRLLAYRVAWLQTQGIVPNYEASMSKLFGSEMQQRLARFGINLLGLYGQLAPGSKWAKLAGRLEQYYLNSVALTIAAGTSEIQRNIIATRGLGLPRA